MKSFALSYPSPQANLAFEQWYFEHFEQNSLRLWINPSSVIIGKHQTAVAEANVDYCRKHGIPILRRISGGGTVYHDGGNINFSFFRPVERGEPIDYDRNLEVIRKALNALGYPAELNARHDLVLEGYKISGNAQHIRRQRALHHGTILYGTDIETLRNAIKRRSGTVTHKAVESFRSRSRNLREYLDMGPVENFFSALCKQLGTSPQGERPSKMPSDDRIEAIVHERYEKAEWNFGYGPKYALQNTIEVGGKAHHLELTVERGGKILECTFTPGNTTTDRISKALKGGLHFPGVIEEKLLAMGERTDPALFF